MPFDPTNQHLDQINEMNSAYEADNSMVYVQKPTDNQQAYFSPQRNEYLDEDVERLDGSLSNSNSRPRMMNGTPHIVEDQYHSKNEGSYFSGDFIKHPSENVGLLPGSHKSLEERKE